MWVTCIHRVVVYNSKTLSIVLRCCCCCYKGSLELIGPALVDETDQVDAGAAETKLEESVIGGCLLDHHSPVSSGSGSQQPDLPICSTTAADDEEIPEETTTVNVRVP